MSARFLGGDSVDPPTTKAVHNQRMINAGMRFRLPCSVICPDCYKPPSMCDHLSDADLAPLWVKPKR